MIMMSMIDAETGDNNDNRKDDDHGDDDGNATGDDLIHLENKENYKI